MSHEDTLGPWMGAAVCNKCHAVDDPYYNGDRYECSYCGSADIREGHACIACGELEATHDDLCNDCYEAEVRAELAQEC